MIAAVNGLPRHHDYILTRWIPDEQPGFNRRPVAG